MAIETERLARNLKNVTAEGAGATEPEPIPSTNAKSGSSRGESAGTLDFAPAPAHSPTMAPAHHPNVVYLVLDDMGFASTGAFGNDVIETPAIDRLAAEGLRYNNFHTTAICSATRASLLTGINHHKAGVATLVDWGVGAPNAAGHIHNSCATTAEMLREHGYATFAVGKWHLSCHKTPAGPYDQWPLGRGFDRYYGFLDGMGDQYHPQLVQDNSFVGQPCEPREGYHLSEDLVDHAIDFVYTQTEAYPKQPFFLYVAFGATHNPFQAPESFVSKYRGRFHEGWDVLRRRWFERQKALGVIPAEADLTKRSEVVPAWDSLSPQEREVAERYVEAFAGFLEHTDAQIGRLVDFLRERGLLDDTLLVLLSDNGASGEGGRIGQFDSLRHCTRTVDSRPDPEALAHGLAHLDEVGGEYSFVHYATGWANALNAPFPWYKVLTFEGGTKDDLVVRWPRGIADPGAVRGQYLHVTDVTPTVLDALGLGKPAFVRGVAQEPFTGVSFAGTFARADAPEVRREQYYEVLGNRAIYRDGWKAVVNHLVHAPDFSRDRWELYHVAEDYSEARDVAAEHPERLAELRAEFLVEAGKNGVFPLLGGIHVPRLDERGPKGELRGNVKDGTAHVFARAAFRDVSKPFFVPRATPELTDREAVDVDRSSHEVRIRARLASDDEGVLVCHGNRFGGFTLFVQDSRLHYVYNANRIAYFEAVSERPLPEGEIELGYRLVGRPVPPEVGPDFDGCNIGADVTLLVNGREAGSTSVNITYVHPLGAIELKANHYTEVSPRYRVPFEFTGTLEEVTFEQLEPSGRFEQISLAEALGQE